LNKAVQESIQKLEAELTKAGKCGFIDSMLPIATNSLYGGFHVYFNARVKSEQINYIIEYVKEKYNIDAFFEARQSYCQFYILKNKKK